MRALTYYVGTTIDGYIAGPHDEVDFYPVSDDHVAHMTRAFPEVLPTHARRQLGCDDAPNLRFDTVIMGRATYQPGLDQGFPDPYAHLRTFVATRQGGLPTPGTVERSADPVETVRALKAEDGDLGIWLCGGGQLAGVLAGEIDELVIKVYPVVAGSGRPVMAGRFDPAGFTQTDERSFASGCVQRTYTRTS